MKNITLNSDVFEIYVKCTTCSTQLENFRYFVYYLRQKDVGRKYYSAERRIID